MNNYTIYCTEAQTKKALELGAPIKINSYPPINGEKFMWLSPPEDAIAWNNSTNCIIPTAEEMISWLEEQEEIHEVEITTIKDEYGEGWYYCIFNKNRCNVSFDRNFPTRKEATLSAIDAALEYLSNEYDKKLNVELLYCNYKSNGKSLYICFT